ncbi:MAG: RNA methyltransferase [Candidatus Marinimicrobia bacterium]|nr:RNA methyltransferase [Candidatus Neomarinimicrobiota bacterium]
MSIKKHSHKVIKDSRPSEVSLLGRKRREIYVIADNIRSLHNVGSLFRTSEAAGIEKLYLVGISGTPPRKEISKTAIGAENNVPWEYHADIIPLLKYFKSENIPIIVLEHTNSSKDFQNVGYSFPLCLVVGNEVDGISEEVMDYADMAVEIPMFGMKQSLNVSVAYGIMLYELIRQLSENDLS